MPTALIGADQYRARLQAISGVFRPTAARWQADAASRMRRRVKTSARMTESIQPGKLNDKKAEVRGDFRLIFIDKGTKPHPIEPKKFSGSKRGGPGMTSALAFPKGGQTIFARRVRHPGSRKHPFIGRSAREALKADPMTPELIRLWNAAGGRVATKAITSKRGTVAKLP